MKSILLPMAEHDAVGSILRAAGLAATRFGSFVEGVYERVEPSVVLASDDTGATTPALIESFEREDTARADRLRQRFEDGMTEQGVGAANRAWREIGAEAAGLAGHARLFDLIVVGRPGRGAQSPSTAVLETALFDSGRALLIAPPDVPEKLGENIMIAWNGSSETARTIAFALPFLHKASRVSVVTVDSGTVAGPGGDGVAAYLRRAGIEAVVDDVVAGSRSAGAAMLDEAEKLGADMMIKGGYTRSRLRQTIFGGPTSHILANAEIPVFMTH